MLYASMFTRPPPSEDLLASTTHHLRVLLLDVALDGGDQLSSVSARGHLAALALHHPGHRIP